jgi:2-oxoisovalerate dehydrogenase E2 component (dihydrolipoyl transacylase)
MPQLGESVHEGTISRWLVKPGERVVEFEPLLQVDTDKVDAEVPAPVTGILSKILVQEGETVQAGAEIAIVETDGEVGAPASTAAGPPPAELAPPARPAAHPPAADPNVRVTRYSPAVQMLAAELHVDLSVVSGTGLDGRVTKKDVQGFVGGMSSAAPAAPPASPPTQTLVPLSAGDEVVPLTRARQLMAENTTRSKATIPHAWQTQEVDMSGVAANRRGNKAAFMEQEGFSLTYLPYVMAAAAAALREHRHVNATFNENSIIVHSDINLGVSVGLEDTLLVPVVRQADGLSIAGLGRAVNDAATRARNRTLKADDLTGGTFTINNSGTFGTLFSYSIVNPGQAAILTMEAVVDRPVASNGMIGIKPMMYLCLSLDHRVLDGLAAGRFLTSCRKWLESVSADTAIF